MKAGHLLPARQGDPIPFCFISVSVSIIILDLTPLTRLLNRFNLFIRAKVVYLL